jgi:CRISPR-associated protein Cas5d
MFERRVERGQWVTPPVLGCREFPARVEWYTGNPQPIAHNEDFGWILHDIRYGTTNQPVFFHAVCLNGIIDVPVLQDRAGAY